MARFTLFAVLLLAATSTTLAGDHCNNCCEQCGCNCQPCKTCRLICETKKVPKVVYSCECEDFCVPDPSCKVCEKEVCNEHCNLCCKLFGHCTHKEPVWSPNGATIYTKKKLVKKTEQKEVPSYKWVVENTCPRCAQATHEANSAIVAAHPDAPIQPTVEAAPSPIQKVSLWESIVGSKTR